MSRPLRIEYPGAWYHVACRGNQRLNIFGDNNDRLRFLRSLKESVEAFNVEIHCYVLMDNHFHFLLRTPEANLGRFMQRFNTAYITYYNLRHHRSGHLYQGRYKAILVEADRYLLELSRYIHLNPLRTEKYCDTPLEKKSVILKDYIWSSLPGYLLSSGRKGFTRYESVLEYMGGDNRRGRTRYLSFILHGLEKNLANPLEETRAGAILGTENFVGRIKEKFLDTGLLRKKDYPGLKQLKRIVPEKELAEAVAKEYGVKPEDIMKPRSKWREARQVLIELCYQMNFQTKSLKELGEELGGIGGDGIAHTHRRIQSRMKKDKNLYLRVRRLYQQVISQ